ncbi:hypothetical protein BKI51_02455 [Alphaproteobacteria bacterium AO1-B]|nr:hypothetical protein BKI51_02455 [Alphaproteobacteria bacterium AO1-B]
MIHEFSADDIQYLTKFGNYLKDNEREKTGLVQPFDSEHSEGSVEKALRFLAYYLPKLQKVLCEEGQVRPEIIAAGATAVVLSDKITMITDIDSETALEFSNLLCVLGLSKICSAKTSS